MSLWLAVCVSGLWSLRPELTRAHADEGVAARIRKLVAEATLGEGIGISVADARTGNILVEHHAEKPLNPASNMKLITAAAALVELGSDFQMRTGLYGRLEAGAIQGGLYLKGYGDPTLTLSDLVALARELTAQGVRSVDEVIVDGSYFDEQQLPPAFEQQPDEIASFRAAVAAVAVDRGAYVLRVRPGAREGDAGTAALDGAGYFEVDNALKTSAGGAPSVVAIQRASGDRMTLLLRGNVPLGIRLLSYRRRIENPLSHAGYVMVDALNAVGIKTPSRVRSGVMPPGLSLLANRNSPSVATLLNALGKDSDNFTAEMLLKVIGAERIGQPGQSDKGARVAHRVLERAGVTPGEATIVNGSGLFEGNRVAAGHLVRLLVQMYADPAFRPEYLQHLAVGGADGTLARRLADLPAPRIVRAKTGTLNDVIALSGYVLGPEPSRSYAFSFLANGVRGKHHAARTLADQIVRALAADLYSATN